MGNRSCPLCFAKVSRTQVLSRSNDVVCPACHAALELSRPSRLLGSFVGVLAAMAAYHLAHPANSMARWTWPMVAAILAFGCASALALSFFSDLVVRSQPHPHSPTPVFPHPQA